MSTYAIYQDTSDGIVRLGTFSGPRGSVRAICAKLKAKMPHLATGQQVYIARRDLVMGKLEDGERIPCDWN